MKQYSQYGQDILLNNLINKQNGFFIDIGAHDGICFSNSYLFETELEWNGICIEPLPNIFKKLEKNRKCILADVGEGGTARFFVEEGQFQRD